MIDRGATTVWEVWDGVDARGKPHASLNHYSKGAVASFLHRYVAGLRVADPGYRVFEVRPRPGGGITEATTRHISPFGPIDVAWQLRAGTLELDLQVPSGTTANVVLPGQAALTVAPGRHHWASNP
jgi:alpha-L-rhamnosidase